MFLHAFIISILLLFGSTASARDEIVDFGGDIGVQTLTSSVSCKPSDWRPDDLSYSCNCCLVKHYLSGDPTRKNVESCVNEKKYCTADSPVARASKEDQPAIIKQIVDRLLVAKELPIEGLSATLTQDDVVKLIKNARENFQAFQLPWCIKAQKQKITSKHAEQVFVIKTNETKGDNCSNDDKDYEAAYILKSSKEPLGEINNLVKIDQKKEISRINIPDLVITKPIFFASYLVKKPSFFVKEKRFYVTLLQAAAGESLRALIDEAAALLESDKAAASALKESKNIMSMDSPLREKLEDIQAGYSTLGRVLAQFHLALKEKDCQGVLCNTVIHGDLHDNNTFYDPKTKTISFIDNESMAASIFDRADPGNDILRVYYRGAAHRDPKSRFPSVIPGEVMAKITLEPFLRAYIGQYPAEKQEEVAKKLRDMMLKNALKLLYKFKAGKYQLYSPLKLAEVQKSYVAPIFDRILEGIH